MGGNLSSIFHKEHLLLKTCTKPWKFNVSDNKSYFIRYISYTHKNYASKWKTFGIRKNLNGHSKGNRQKRTQADLANSSSEMTYKLQGSLMFHINDNKLYQRNLLKYIR